MPSRRDQVQAYFFTVERLVAALMHGHPDAPETPNRRIGVAAVFGLVLAVLVAGIFGIYGLFVPGGNSSWQNAGAIIVAKETGARYLYLDGVLRPVLNYTSARLIISSASNGGAPATVSVSQNSLSGVPVGAPIGIQGAPDALPTTLTAGPWTVCTQPPDPDTAGTTPQPKVTLVIGSIAGTTAADAQGVLVSTADGTRYLLWRGERFRLASNLAVNALGYGGVDPLVVTPAWINPIPSGPDLTTPQLPGIGEHAPAINGKSARIGQVYDAHNGLINSDQLYVLSQNGMVPISRTVATLVLADPAIGAAYPAGNPAPIQIPPSALTGQSITAEPNLSSGYPDTPPSLVDAGGDSLPCMRYSWGSGGNPAAALVFLDRSAVNGAAVATETHAAGAAADQVVIPAGTGILAHDVPTAGAKAGTEYLITDDGVRFPLSSASVPSYLGLVESAAVNVPSQLLVLLPTGPVLDPGAALTTQQSAG